MIEQLTTPFFIAVDDLLKSLKAQLYDRAVSPLFSSLLISWVAWNHRLIAVMLSNWPVEKKFEYIDNVLYPGWRALGPTILFPIISAFALIFLYPIPARYVYKHVRSEQKKLKEIQRAIEDETPITQEEAVELRAAIRKARREFENEIESREANIFRLQEDLKRAESHTKAAEDFNVILDDEQVNVLAEICRRGSIDYEMLFTKLSLQRMVLEHIIDELKRFSMINETSNENDERYLAGTPEGRTYLVDHHRSLFDQSSS